MTIERHKSLQKPHSEHGQSLVEFAIGMVFLFFLLGGLVDLGRTILIMIAVENASGEGASYSVAHPECIAPDHAATICQGNQSIVGRVIEEGKPAVTIDSGKVDVILKDGGTEIAITGGDDILPGRSVCVEVSYEYSPLTPTGFLIWGTTGEITAATCQEILSPPYPGYRY